MASTLRRRLVALAGSVWNTRGWTLQEYIAAKKVRFYTEDWTLYRDLPLSNHKECPEVIAEVEQATGVSAQQLMSLRPGLSNIREKLRLASTRSTTRVEDAAYSLLGIFEAAGISAIYGEGEVSLGRLLANILTRSGDVSILAWAGESSRFNSCLPARITVFNSPAKSHLPEPISDAGMQKIIAAQSSFDLSVALRLLDRLNELPTPKFAESRMILPCITFLLPSYSHWQSRPTRLGRIYWINTVAFGMVEIKTKQDLSRIAPLYLIHPWLDSLLQHEDRSSVGMEDAPPLSPDMDDEDFYDEYKDDDEYSDGEFNDDEELSDGDTDDYLSAVSTPELHDTPATTPMDREPAAQRLVARLQQPFGALLLTETSSGGRVPDYRRVAADSLITVRFQDGISLADILGNVRTLEVL